MPLLEATALSKHFQARRGIFGGERGTVRAVDGISFVIEPGQTRPWLIKGLEMCLAKRESGPPRKHGNIPL